MVRKTNNIIMVTHLLSAVITARHFLPARRYASAGLCDSDVSVCLSVRLSVRHTPVLCLAERKQDREMYTV